MSAGRVPSTFESHDEERVDESRESRASLSLCWLNWEKPAHHQPLTHSDRQHGLLRAR